MLARSWYCDFYGPSPVSFCKYSFLLTYLRQFRMAVIKISCNKELIANSWVEKEGTSSGQRGDWEKKQRKEERDREVSG